jgi:hypothetical protein
MLGVVTPHADAVCTRSDCAEVRRRPRRSRRAIHTPSFSIGDSLGDIKVALMDLRNRSERIEGAMLSREYFDHAMDARDKSSLVIGKLDQSLPVLSEFDPRTPSIEPSRPTLEPRTPSLGVEREDHLGKVVLSVRLQQVLDTFKTRQRTTPKQLASFFGIATNTACEHLRNLERLGRVRRVGRGLHEVL